MDFFKLFSHPLRLQIMQYLAVNGQATTKQIAAAIPSASAPTVYRHINLLLNEGLLLIREKREVRGGAERVLAIDEARMTRAADESIDNTAWQYARACMPRFANTRSGRTSVRNGINSCSPAACSPSQTQSLKRFFPRCPRCCTGTCSSRPRRTHRRAGLPSPPCPSTRAKRTPPNRRNNSMFCKTADGFIPLSVPKAPFHHTEGEPHGV